MRESELIEQVAEILAEQAKVDSAVRKVWTGDPATLSEPKLCQLRCLKVTIEVRKRESKKEKIAASEPWSKKSEPWSINLWRDYMSDDWAGADWHHVDDFWEECSECHNHPKHTCSSCGGSGRKTCPKCDGDGQIVKYE